MKFKEAIIKATLTSLAALIYAISYLVIWKASGIEVAVLMALGAITAIIHSK